MYVSYLSIEWIFLQLIHTLEVISVALCHYQTVLHPLEEVSLVQHLIAGSSGFSLPLYIRKCSTPSLHQVWWFLVGQC